LGTICYAVCHVCRCCSWARYVTQSDTYVAAVVQSLYQLNELLSDPTFFITSKPGAGQQSITNLAKSEITALPNSETYVAAVVQCLYQLNQFITVSIFFITSKPGAGLQSITNLAKVEITALTNTDMVIVC